MCIHKTNIMHHVSIESETLKVLNIIRNAVYTKSYYLDINNYLRTDLGNEPASAV